MKATPVEDYTTPRWKAATGVSAGKLNLRLVEASKSQSETVVTNRKTGKQITFRLQADFLKRYLDTPTAEQPAGGREVALMPESDIFAAEVRSTPASKNQGYSK
jgi:hypothetical protein